MILDLRYLFSGYPGLTKSVKEKTTTSVLQTSLTYILSLNDPVALYPVAPLHVNFPLTTSNIYK